jgi:hypothetical protein
MSSTVERTSGRAADSRPGGTPVFFAVGRMNPPTPGHVELIRQTVELARRHGGVARIYITQTTNKEHARCKPGGKCCKNPLDPQMKKAFIDHMLRLRGIPRRDRWGDVVVSDPACNGLFKGAGCARAALGAPERWSNRLFLVMGVDREETDAKEFAGRVKKCDGQFAPSDAAAISARIAEDRSGEGDNWNTQCVLVERRAMGAEGAGVNGVSGTHVRRLMMADRIDELAALYEGYMTAGEVRLMARLACANIRAGSPGEAPKRAASKGTRKASARRTAASGTRKAPVSATSRRMSAPRRRRSLSRSRSRSRSGSKPATNASKPPARSPLVGPAPGPAPAQAYSSQTRRSTRTRRAPSRYSARGKNASRNSRRSGGRRGKSARTSK